MQSFIGKDITFPIIPTSEELQILSLDRSLEIGDGIRKYLLEVLVCQPDIYPTQLNQLPKSVQDWVQQAQEQYEDAFIRGEYDSATKFAFWLEKLALQLQNKGLSMTITPREKSAFARNREGIKSLKFYCTDLFDRLWDHPLIQKEISADRVIMLEEILPGAFRYLQLRGVQLQP